MTKDDVFETVSRDEDRTVTVTVKICEGYHLSDKTIRELKDQITALAQWVTRSLKPE